MLKEEPKTYVAYPAVLPYPLLCLLGAAIKWFIILACVASVPFTLYRCFQIIADVVRNPQPPHAVRQQHIPNPAKGYRP
jgi:hypothetical protein